MITKQQIKFIRSLQQKKYRDQHQVFLAEGVKLVNEALQLVPDLIQYLLYTAKSRPLISDFDVIKKTAAIEIKSSEFKALSTQKSPQEVMAVIKQNSIPLPTNDKLGDLTLALDRIQDPGNLGTIIRIADWFGIKNIICSEDTVECYNPKVIRATMGAIFRVNLSYTNLKDYFSKFIKAKSGIIYGTSLDGDSLYSQALNSPAIIVLGNEANGMNKDFKPFLDRSLLIPNFSKSSAKSESLNVSMAAGIICSEFRRQKR